MFTAMIKRAARLDAQTFLGFRTWQFSLLNAGRWFPWYFLLRIMVMHPTAAWRGLLRYRRLVRRSPGKEPVGTVPLAALIDKVRQREEPLLIAPGFCLKPYDYEKNRSICPAGHFNHRCILLENAANTVFQPSVWPAPCRKCGIATLVKIAAIHSADFYIMTSAIDIAQDVYLPAIRRRGPRLGLFFLCPYSVDPFTFGLAITGIKGALVQFCRGDCQTHAEWTDADRGLKNDQTAVDEKQWRSLVDDLVCTNDSKLQHVEVVREGNLYHISLNPGL